MGTDQDSQGDRDGEQDERQVPQHPESRQAETVDALEDQQVDDDPGDGEQVSGDDVTENPESDEMEGLPGPPEGEAGEPAG